MPRKRSREPWSPVVIVAEKDYDAAMNNVSKKVKYTMLHAHHLTFLSRNQFALRDIDLAQGSPSA